MLDENDRGGRARQAFELEPPAGPWYAMAGLLYGAALRFSGQSSAAAKTLERAAYLGRQRQPSVANFALAQLSLLAADRGDWAAAQDCAAESATLIEAAGLLKDLASIVSYIARARVAVHTGDVTAARHHVGRAPRLYASPSPAALPWLAVETAFILGRILLELDDHPAARLKLTEAGRELNRLPTEGVLRDDYQRLAADLARHGGRPRVAIQIRRPGVRTARRSSRLDEAESPVTTHSGTYAHLIDPRRSRGIAISRR